MLSITDEIILQIFQAHIIVDDIPPTYRMRPPHERRTPEAYGRMSQQMRMQQQQLQQQQIQNGSRLDYEDIYNNQIIQQQQKQQLAMHQSAIQLAQMRTGINRSAHMNRPHSADFLEYEPPQEPMSPQTPNPGRAHSRHHRPQPPRPKSSIEQRMLMDKQTFEESQIRSQSRASGVYDRGYQPPLEQPQFQHQTPQTRVKYYPPIPSPHDSQLDLASEEVSRYFPTPSPRKSLSVSSTLTNHQNPHSNHQSQMAVQNSSQQYNLRIDNQNVPNRRQSTGDYQVFYFIYEKHKHSMMRLNLTSKKFPTETEANCM